MGHARAQLTSISLVAPSTAEPVFFWNRGVRLRLMPHRYDRAFGAIILPSMIFVTGNSFKEIHVTMNDDTPRASQNCCKMCASFLA